MLIHKQDFEYCALRLFTISAHTHTHTPSHTYANEEKRVSASFKEMETIVLCKLIIINYVNFSFDLNFRENLHSLELLCAILFLWHFLSFFTKDENKIEKCSRNEWTELNYHIFHQLHRICIYSFAVCEIIELKKLFIFECI